MGTIVTVFWMVFGAVCLFMIILAFRRSAPDKYTVEQRFTAQVESHWMPRIRRTEKAEARAAKRIERSTNVSDRQARKYLRLQNKARRLRRDMGKDVDYHIKGAKGVRVGPDGQPRGGIGRYGTAHKGLMPLPATSKERKRAAKSEKSIRLTGRTERKKQRKNGT